MAKTFYVSPGRSYTVTASEGTTITYPGITKPAATVGSEGSVTFNCTGTEIVVSDDDAKIAQNFNNAGAAVAGAGGGSGSTEGVALLEGGNSFSGDQTITGDVTIDGAVTISGDITAEGEYNGAEVIETQDTTIIPEAGKYYKYTGTGDTITVAAPVWNGYMTISYLETAEPVELEGVTWSPAKPSLTGAGPFVYTLVCAESGKVLASAMNYSVATAEAIQKVVPIKWFGSTTPTLTGYGIALGSEATATDAVCIGGASSAGKSGVVVGVRAQTTGDNAVALGEWSNASKGAVALGSNAVAYYTGAVVVGNMTKAQSSGIAVGYWAQSNKSTAITIGSLFSETTPDGYVTHTCNTEGTGSITIGAGANTLNNGTTESSNSVTIGCKAENKSADSVVIGASAKLSGQSSILIGAGTKSIYGNSIAIGLNVTAGANGMLIGNNASGTRAASLAIGHNAFANNGVSIGHGASSEQLAVAIGNSAKVTKNIAISIGQNANADAHYSTAIGYKAKVADLGAVVFRSTADDENISTQLYFSGANTPLANTYEGGEAMMGYAVTDKNGNIMTDAEGNAMVGTQKLSVLFPNNRGENAFTPAMLGLDDEWTPKPMFRPSDIDMPQEEQTEPEEYTPLPVYPIVEPEMPSELPSEEL
jgi:hypothetical protein